MIRFLVAVAVVFAAVLGFEWLKDAPGELALTVNDRVYAVGLARGALALMVVVAAAMAVVWLGSLIWTAPSRAARAWRNSREGHIRSILAQGLLSVAAGDMRAAERAAAEAMKRAPDAPLTRLLRAQVAEVNGDYAGAETVFTAMLEDDRTRVAGLRGMHIEAERAGNAVAARHYAEAAQKLAPGAAWANRALLRAQIAAGDWEGALSTLNVSADSRALDKATLRRHRAVILTAQAMELEDSEPERARQIAMQAHALAPDLAPAATLAGRVLARLGDVRRATKVLETSWKAAPHPDIADAYAHVRSGDAARDRLKRVDALMRMRPQADEGRLALVRAAIDARDWTLARATLRPLLITRPTQNAFVLMAEIEEGEHGDRGRAREFLSRAVRAPRDPAWVADGMVLSEWAPASPVSGRIDAVEWRVPAQRLGGPTAPEAIEVDEAMLRPTPMLVTASPAKAEAEAGGKSQALAGETAAPPKPPRAARQPEPPPPPPPKAGTEAGKPAEPAEERPPPAAGQSQAAPSPVAASALGGAVAVSSDKESGEERGAGAQSSGESASSAAKPDRDRNEAQQGAAQPPDDQQSEDEPKPAAGGVEAKPPVNGDDQPEAGAGAEPGADGGDGDGDTEAGPEDAPPDPITLPRPDDPGVDDDAGETDDELERRRFRLF